MTTNLQDQVGGVCGTKRPGSRAAGIAGALCVVLAFGALFAGKVLMYPAALVPGTLLDRLRAEPWAWDVSHRVMLGGFVLLVPAGVAMWAALRERSAWLSFLGAWLLVLSAVLSAGQFALDFAFLEAARALPAESGQAFVDALLANSFVRAAFYDGPNLGGIGVILLAIAMARQGRAWWPAAGMLTLGIALSLVEKRFGPIGSRITIGVQFVGFTLAAWRMFRGRGDPR